MGEDSFSHLYPECPIWIMNAMQLVHALACLGTNRMDGDVLAGSAVLQASFARGM